MAAAAHTYGSHKHEARVRLYATFRKSIDAAKANQFNFMPRYSAWVDAAARLHGPQRGDSINLGGETLNRQPDAFVLGPGKSMDQPQGPVASSQGPVASSPTIMRVGLDAWWCCATDVIDMHTVSTSVGSGISSRRRGGHGSLHTLKTTTCPETLTWACACGTRSQSSGRSGRSGCPESCCYRPLSRSTSPRTSLY